MTTLPPPSLTAAVLVSRTLGHMRRDPRALVAPLAALGIVFGFFISDTAWRLERWASGYPFPLNFLAALLEFLTEVGPFLLIPFAVLAMTAAARAAFMPYLDEGRPDGRLARQAVSPIFSRSLITFAIMVPPVGFAMVPFGIPGTILLGILVAVPAILVAEGTMGLAPLKRSFELARGHILETTLAVAPATIAVIFAVAVFEDLPYLGDLIFGAAIGAALAYVAVLSTVFYAARTALPTPPEVATRNPTVTSPSEAPPPPAAAGAASTTGAFSEPDPVAEPTARTRT